MTENEAKEMLQAKLTCMNLEDLACIEKGCSRNCNDCEYNYAQGARGEQEKAIKIAINIFEEIQQYRATGLNPSMVEDLKKSEKQAHKDAVENALKLEEYEALGTKRELREAMEKQMAKRPTNEFHKKYTRHMGDCPNCKSGISSRKLYCPYCGQKIDWGK